MKDFVEELKWRGMIQDIMPGTREHLTGKMRAAYVGIDPTADSLHIGHLAGIMMLRHFQLCGHKPFALIGGATGMIGDPSGKSAERALLGEDILRHNQDAIKSQLSKLMDFSPDAGNAAVLVNNHDWMKDFSFLEFVRDIGKHITVNYMMAKDSVKKRLSLKSSDGMSFTEFTYQLVQGYDFLHLYQNKNCTVQMGGSDQWGNMTTGTELVRRIGGGKAFAMTCPLITKADGAKFGKTEEGNIWLDAKRTSPYKFYQYWLNASDADAEKYIKIFTFLTKEEIGALTAAHRAAPHTRSLQKKLAKEITSMVHSKEELDKAAKASGILFGKSGAEDLDSLDETTLLQVFEGIPKTEISPGNYQAVANVTDLLSKASNGIVFSSKGEARRMIKGGGVSINKQKIISAESPVNFKLLHGKHLLVQKGKKNYCLVTVLS